MTGSAIMTSFGLLVCSPTYVLGSGRNFSTRWRPTSAAARQVSTTSGMRRASFAVISKRRIVRILRVLTSFEIPSTVVADEGCQSVHRGVWFRNDEADGATYTRMILREGEGVRQE